MNLKENRITRRSLIKGGLGSVISIASGTGFGLSKSAPSDGRGTLDSSPPTETAGGAEAKIMDNSTSDKKPIDFVNGLFGTSSLDDRELLGNAPPPGEELYSGMTCPGAKLPFGIDVSPVNKDISLAYPHGNLYSYVHSRRTMVGFGSMVTDMLIMPLVGDWTTPPDRIRYASVYNKNTERSSPGRYSVHLADHNITADLSGSALSGFYQFTFPKSDRATILFDLGPATSSTIEIVGDRTVRGQADGDKTFFVVEFSKPFGSFGTFHRNPTAPGMVGYGWFVPGIDVVRSETRIDNGSYAGCYLNYSTSEGERVLLKIASGASHEEALSRLKTENPGWDFQSVVRTARQVWSKQLNAIEVKGGSEQQRSIFYSALYHAFASPIMVARKGQQFLGEDNQRRIAEHDRYDRVPYWDTGRNQVVLMTLLNPEVKRNILQSQLDRARESGWMGTSFHGDHAVAMFLGDWERGVPFDYKAAYEYLRKNATDPTGPRPNLAEYLQKGWIHDIEVKNPSPPYEEGNAGVSKVLEYCYDDYCMARYAEKLGNQNDYRMFLARASNYRNVWDASTRFMRGKKEDGSWMSPFYPGEPYYNFMYKESNAWQTSWFVPHDVQGLISLLGGREAFVKRLDEFFTLPYRPKAIARDVTGMIGQYCHGNEPDHHAAFLYNWAGAPWKTQELVRKIMRLMYGSDKEGLGLAGMDDQGENSSWYVLNAIGFYTVDPARAEYIIGSPIFDEVVMHMGNGKDFVVQTENNSSKNIYIQSASLNGKQLNRPWFEHAAIANGGKLEFRMGPSPNKNWGSSPDSIPASMSSQ
ncbi:MAG: GH92 family glycosyl hydrolase [Acidobacteriota bacterium]|nr:GH92 family glycosyl hydrolase [Acidobacteriota bacterium]